MRHGYLYSKQHLFAKAWKNHMKLEMINIPQNIEIILLIIISVVWLTNFLSGIWNLINPWRWVEQLLLSMKKCEKFCKMSYTCYPLVGSKLRSCSLIGFQNISIRGTSLLCVTWNCKILLVYLYRAVKNSHLIKQNEVCIPQTH